MNDNNTNSATPKALEEMLFKLIQTLTRDVDPQAILLKMTDEIKKATHSDRVTLHYIKRTAGGPIVESWDHDQDKPQSGPLPLKTDKGLISWVLLNNDWLVANAKTPQGIASLIELESGENGRIKRSAESSAEYTRTDNESAMCFFPLTIDDAPSKVVLEISRISNFSAYQRTLVEKLYAMTPIIASVCMRVIELEQMDTERKAITELANKINEQTNFADADRILLRTLISLSGAYGAVMLQYSQSKFHYCIANEWTNSEFDKVKTAQLKSLFRSFSCNQGEAKKSTTDDLLLVACRELLSLVDSEGITLIPRSTTLILPDQEKAVVLIDRKNSYFDRNAPANSQQVLASCQQVVDYSQTLLSHYKKSHIRHVIKCLTNTHRHLKPNHAPEDFEKSQQILISSTLQAIFEACECDAVLIYLGDLQTTEVKGTLPAIENMSSLNISVRSLTQKVIVNRKSYLIADINDKKSKYHNQLSISTVKVLANAFDLGDIKSWLACPITLYDDTDIEQCYGVVKLLTAQSGIMLSQDVKEVVEAIAQRTYWEFHYLLKQYALYDLNLITTKLTGVKGSQLRATLINEMEHWTRRYIRPDCRIFIYAYTKDSKGLLQSASAGLTPVQKEALINASIAFGKEDDEKIKSNSSYTAVPIRINRVQDIKGHVFFISESHLDEVELNFCKEVSSEINLLVYQEYLHYRQKEYFAVLRHSIMGPVQGLSTRAMSALRRAKKAEGNSAAVISLEQGIHEENESIRHWKDVSQVLGEGSKAKIQSRSNDLTRLMSKCIARYQPIAKSRNIYISSDFMLDSKKSVFYFDKGAIDIVISNLLDNAVKYAFFNTTISVKCSIAPPNVQIRITDIGHKTPESNIFTKGARLDWEDPFRIIAGEGYGLAICKSLVEAHKGRIAAKSTPENEHTIGEDATRRYRVTLTITLPYKRD
jgi:signal transduction histidine kinase/GAF domain-containing protein